MRKNEYVLIVIGAGSGGLGMLNLGFRVLLIDKKGTGNAVKDYANIIASRYTGK